MTMARLEGHFCRGKEGETPGTKKLNGLIASDVDDDLANFELHASPINSNLLPLLSAICLQYKKINF
jgi:hypothetical protein